MGWYSRKSANTITSRDEEVNQKRKPIPRIKEASLILLVQRSTNDGVDEIKYSMTWRKNRKHELEKRILWMACWHKGPQVQAGSRVARLGDTFPKTDLVNYRLKNISGCLLLADWITTTAVQTLVGADPARHRWLLQQSLSFSWQTLHRGSERERAGVIIQLLCSRMLTAKPEHLEWG